MDIKEVLLKRIDIEGLIMEDLFNGVIVKKLEEVVADSSNTLDDTVLALAKPEIEKALREFVQSKLADLA